MKRRTLFGFLPLGLFGFWPRRSAADEPLVAPPAAPLEPYRDWLRRQNRTGPTMERLIVLAENHPAERSYYTRLLWAAIDHTGPIASSVSGFSVLYHITAIAGPEHCRCRSFIQTAATVRVPSAFLSYFRPEDRGDDFPRGVPFKRMP